MFDELKKLFIQEVKELLDKTEKNLLELEKQPNNENILQEIFRSMHTIKGSAGLYGLSKTSKLAHSFEDLFAKIKEHKLEADKNIISLALKAKDTILKLIEAKNEDDIPNSEIDFYIDSINSKIKNENKNVNQNIEIKNLASYYITFEPNSDITNRGIKLDSILSDFDDFEYKIITELQDKNRTKNNKLEKFYEIIVASEYNEEELSSIFLFTPTEYQIKKISDSNIFEEQEFYNYYENAIKILPFSEQRYNLIKAFADQTQNNQETENTSDTKNEQNKTLEEIQSIKEKQIQYIKIPAQKLDDLLNLVSELIISNSQLKESIISTDYNKLLHLSENIGKTINSIKENTLDLRLIPIKNIIEPYRRIIRDLSQQLNKKIEFIEEGVDTQVDKTIVEKLYSPLLHIIRNAIDHGIEEPQERIKKGKNSVGVIRFIAYYSNTNVVVQIQDDGRGIDPEKVRQRAIELNFIRENDKLSNKEILDLIFLPGFSMSKKITNISGRGVGMDAIKQAILELRGDIEVDSEIGLGTSITIKLPFTLSIIDTLHVSSNNIHFLIPISNIDRCIDIKHSELKEYSGKRIILEDELIPYIDIRDIFNLGGNKPDKENFILLNFGNKKLGLIFERIHGEYQAVIKNMGTFFTQMDYLLGASILGDGSISYILDAYKLMKKIK
jgi:two-component system chemotaxis sensor kinase CheA